MMERLGIPITRGHLFGWHHVCVWVRHLGQGTHTWAALNREEAAYASQLHLAAQLADLYDLIATARFGEDAWRIRYPRPWDEGREHFGEDPIPISEFDSWYYGGETCQQ